MNNFYTTVSRIDQKDMNSKMIYGITAKSKTNGNVMFADYKISCDMKFVDELRKVCQTNQPDEQEFRNLICSYKLNEE